ncbi:MULTISPECIES: hypothetical protein [Pseudomonas]|jgi:hypothetical protein|uniref:hypothetical protein n=1 Tax=Pseudomonas TaxID=286 RepID=UPI0020C53F48|nr:hypothetical protein [Pseudomonas fluorescens]MDI9776968.1 hypothetical protein [Pseudomonas putida]UTL91027.1 hypothetical protein NLL86_26985 [Pseudomonas fluorescens]
MNNDEVLQTLAHLIGTPYEPSVKEIIRELTGRTRIVGPNEFSTRDFDSNRIHIRADANQLITGFAFN